MLEGLVVKSYSHWYDVLAGGRVIPSQPRGRLRREEGGVRTGDRVRVELRPDGTGWIAEVLPRRNALLRPPVANVDRVLVVFTLRRPEVEPRLVDRILCLAEDAEVPPVLVLNKADLLAPGEAEAALAAYRAAGYPAFVVSALRGEGLEPLRLQTGTGVTVVAGPSGVGKSSLLNALRPGLRLQTGTVSGRDGRGRHTTRHAELLPLGGGWVCDTPGFSRLDLTHVDPQRLGWLFPEFRSLIPRCRFDDCRHRAEPGCAVKGALAEGGLAASRYASYLALLDEVEDWERHRYR